VSLFLRGNLLAVILLFASCTPIPYLVHDVEITITRNGNCNGNCPWYSMTIHGNGNIEYTGIYDVIFIGRHYGHISQDTIISLVHDFNAIGYYALRDRYDTANVFDAATTTTSIQVGSKYKRVINHVGGPRSLQRLEERIEQAVTAIQWIGTPEDNEKLIKDNWTNKRAMREQLDSLEQADDEILEQYQRLWKAKKLREAQHLFRKERVLSEKIADTYLLFQPSESDSLRLELMQKYRKLYNMPEEPPVQ
jgi:hypothetical protein